MTTQRVQHLNHKGKEILLIDFSNVSGQAFIEVINEVHAYVKNLGKKDVLEIIDVTNSFVNQDVLKVLQNTAAESKKHVKKRAVLGMSGIKLVFLNAINMFSKEQIIPCKSIEEAKEFLVQE